MSADFSQHTPIQEDIQTILRNIKHTNNNIISTQDTGNSLVNAFDSLSKHSSEDLFDALSQEQSIRGYLQQLSSNQVGKSMMDLIFLYISYLHNQSSKDSLKILLKVSDSAKALLGVMTAEHKHLITFIVHFIKLVNTAYKHKFSSNKNLKEERILQSEYEHHYQTWVSLINKEIKDKECQYKESLILMIYNIQLSIRFSKYDYPGCQAILKHTVNYQPINKDQGINQNNTNTNSNTWEFPVQLLNQPKAEQVYYLYYFGRLAVFNQDYSVGSECLQRAFDLCPKNCYKQRRQILKYLIPVNMQNGRFPSVALIKEYHLFEYLELGIAIQEGNIAKLEAQREIWMKCWIKRSLYMLIGQLQILTYRNLAKRVLTVMQHLRTPTKFNIDIKAFKTAFELSAQRTFQPEEVACLLGNLFYPKKYLNAFIHKTNTDTLVIFSAKDPCPKIKPS